MRRHLRNFGERAATKQKRMVAGGVLALGMIVGVGLPLIGSQLLSPNVAAVAAPISATISPTSGPLGTIVTITVSGLASGGRVDFSVGGNSLGSVEVTGTSASLTTDLWAESPAVITATYLVGSETSETTVTFGSAAPVTTAPTTTTPATIPPTTTPATTTPATTAPPTTTIVPPTTATTTIVNTTVVPTTVPPAPTTAPPLPGTRRVVATPNAAALGDTITLTASGLSPAVGRVDFLIGPDAVGSAEVLANGTATLITDVWREGISTVTANWVRFVDGDPITVSFTTSISVGDNDPAATTTVPQSTTTTTTTATATTLPPVTTTTIASTTTTTSPVTTTTAPVTTTTTRPTKTLTSLVITEAKNYAYIAPLSYAEDLLLTGVYSDGSRNAVASNLATWDWSNRDVIRSIDVNGRLTGYVAGTSEVRATYLGIVGSTNIVVPDRTIAFFVTPAPAPPSTNGQYQVTVGDQIQMASGEQRWLGNAIPVASNQVEWVSSNPAVASISSAGLITVNRAGAFTINSTYTNGYIDPTADPALIQVYPKRWSASPKDFVAAALPAATPVPYDVTKSVVIGTYAPGNDLSCVNSSFSINPSYTWTRNFVVVANTATYAVTAADVGAQLACVFNNRPSDAVTIRATAGPLPTSQPTTQIFVNGALKSRRQFACDLNASNATDASLYWSVAPPTQLSGINIPAVYSILSPVNLPLSISIVCKGFLANASGAIAVSSASIRNESEVIQMPETAPTGSVKVGVTITCRPARFYLPPNGPFLPPVAWSTNTPSTLGGLGPADPGVFNTGSFTYTPTAADIGKTIYCRSTIDSGGGGLGITRQSKFLSIVSAFYSPGITIVA